MVSALKDQLLKLVIAEKPSLARQICKALEARGEHFQPKDRGEYYEGKDYYVTSQFGHLFELKKPNEYAENKEKDMWQLSCWPFFPNDYEYVIKKDCQTRFKTIKSLVDRPDVTEIIHCGDADREGQLLVDMVLEQAGNRKNVTRPQFKATTPAAINAAFDRREENTKFRSIHEEGLARQLFDWDFGMNLSSYSTIKSGARPALNVGRVKGAIVSEIYDRDMEIKHFKAEKYYRVISNKDGLKLISKEKFGAAERTKAAEYAVKLQAADTTVTDITTAPVTKRRPKLFSQTTLQSFMSKGEKWAPDKTLSVAQKLYESGLITYPRTSTEYLTTEEMPLAEAIIKRVDVDASLQMRKDKGVFDDSKIDGHSAIIITGTRPTGISDDEMRCFMAVLNRFKAVFCKEECVYDKTTMILHNPHEDFRVSGEVLRSLGWQRFEPPKKTDSNNGDQTTLPKLSIGQHVNTDFKPEEKETTPPPHYTVDTLGKWMLNPFAKEKGNDEDDDEDYKSILAGLEIGTEATRAPTIKTLVDKGYISLKKSTYYIEERGIFMVDVCRALGIDFSKETTAQMGKLLRDVGKGKITKDEVLNIERREIQRIISANPDISNVAPSTKNSYTKKEKIDKAVYVPSGEEITFNKEWGGHTFTDEEIQYLLIGDTITFTAKSKKGKTYTAKGKLEKQKYKGKTFWGFKLSEELPETWSGHTFTNEERELLLAGEAVHCKDFVSARSKKRFECDVLFKNGKIDPQFERKKRQRR